VASEASRVTSKSEGAMDKAKDLAKDMAKDFILNKADSAKDGLKTIGRVADTAG
jgi:hypothetical protein